MHTRFQTLARALFALTTVFIWSAAANAQIKVITSGGFRTAYEAVLPEFEQITGIKVTTSTGPSQGNTPTVIGAQLRRGVPADVILLSREGLDELIAEGRIVKGSDVNLAQTPTGMAVRMGAPIPDISTVEAFKQTLLRAKSIAIPSSTTGIYLVKELFPRLGIAEALASKSSTSGPQAVAQGEVEITIRPASELLSIEGVSYIGPIPAELQFISVFSAAIVAGSKEIDASKRLIEFLASGKATIAIRKAGMEPVKAR
jgi:molybdate transport system substrate-binding protein